MNTIENMQLEPLDEWFENYNKDLMISDLCSLLRQACQFADMLDLDEGELSLFLRLQDQFSQVQRLAEHSGLYPAECVSWTHQMRIDRAGILGGPVNASRH